MRSTFEQLLLDIASQAITDKLNNTNTIDKQKLISTYNEFTLPKATFVTITQNGNLRGCIGSLVAHRGFLDDLISNAQSAVFNDPRFAPLSKEEFDSIDIELSLLTAPKKLEFSDMTDLKTKIEIGIDGVILKQDGKQATFLPQVWEQLPSFDMFFGHLFQKANITSPNNTMEIYTYNVKKIK